MAPSKTKRAATLKRVKAKSGRPRAQRFITEDDWDNHDLRRGRRPAFPPGSEIPIEYLNKFMKWNLEDIRTTLWNANLKSTGSKVALFQRLVESQLVKPDGEDDAAPGEGPNPNPFEASGFVEGDDFIEIGDSEDDLPKKRKASRNKEKAGDETVDKVQGPESRRKPVKSFGFLQRKDYSLTDVSDDDMSGDGYDEEEEVDLGPFVENDMAFKIALGFEVGDLLNLLDPHGPIYRLIHTVRGMSPADAYATMTLRNALQWHRDEYEELADLVLDGNYDFLTAGLGVDGEFAGRYKGPYAGANARP